MSDKPLPTDLEFTLDPVFREHPHDRLDRLRADDPVHLDAELGGLFLTRFEDMRAVLTDRLLSVDPRKVPFTPRRRAMMADLPPEGFQPGKLRNSKMRYSLPVRCTGWSSTETILVSRLTDNLPVRIAASG
jgi:hypothetical protein